MNKQSGRDLFNISLTEIIIILFFVLMLFAIFQINSLNEEKKVIEKQNENLLAQVNAKGDNISANPIIKDIDPEAPVEDMTAEEKIVMISEAIDRLKGYEEQDPEIAGADVDPCEANPFECLPDCWQLKKKAPSGRDYEYVFDIAICGSRYFVQRAPIDVLGEYTGEDFRGIPNANKLDYKFFENVQLESLFGAIRKYGENQAKQCRYSVNLVDIKSSKNENIFANTKSAIVNNFKVEKVDQNKIGYSEYLKRFPKNICSAPKTRKITKRVTEEEERTVSMSEAWRLAKSNSGQLNWVFKKRPFCAKYKRKRNKSFAFQLEVLIGKSGSILDFEHLFVDPTNYKVINADRNQKRLLELIKDEIWEQRGVPFINKKGKSDYSLFKQTLRVQENLCQTL